MAATNAADEARRAYIATMGAELGALFHALWQQVAWLHLRWYQYIELYGSKPSRVELLNQAAPTFFRIVQDLLWEQTLLDIARLTDPPNLGDAGRRPDLTVLRLASLIEDPALRRKVEAAAARAADAAAFCHHWRSRPTDLIDPDLILEKGGEPLSPANRVQVKIALNAIVEVLNEVSGHFNDSSSNFDFSWERGGAGSLLHLLEDGLKLDAERQRRLGKSIYVANEADLEDL